MTKLTKKLILKFFQGLTTAVEEEKILNAPEVNETLMHQWENFDDVKSKTNAPDFDALYRGIMNESKLVEAIKHQQPKKRFIWWQIAASLLIAATMFFGGRYSVLQQDVISQNTELGRTNPKGIRSQLYLPDGTKVWLNSDSEISYPKNFDGKDERLIHLKGEAFFDVAKNAEKPFIVEISGMKVRALGTQFNVRNYNSENLVKATLVEGSVEVTHEAGKPVVLKPGQMAIYNKAKNEMIHGDVDIEFYTSWKDGYLRFDNQPFIVIARELERWYDIEIVLSEDLLKNDRYTLTIKDESLQKVMELMQLTTSISYEMKNNKLYIRGN